jgi:serine O-acetyltransferase
VTIGFNQRGKNKGYPTIGDNVYIGPGAKIFGKITIGNNVAIGANAVVNSDVPSICTFGGIPAKKISNKGSDGLIQNKIN